MTVVPNPIPARMKGLNRTEICDVNFQEFVRGGTVAAMHRRRRTKRSSTAARWMPKASASCSNRSWSRATST